MNLLGKFEGYRNGKSTFLLKLGRILIGIFSYIFTVFLLEQFIQNVKILVIIKILFIIGLIYDYIKSAKRDGKQVFSVYENTNHKLVIKGKNSRGKSYTDIIDKIEFTYQKSFKNKDGEKVMEEHFKCEIDETSNLIVFYHLENDNKTMEEIIKENKLDIEIIDK